MEPAHIVSRVKFKTEKSNRKSAMIKPSKAVVAGAAIAGLLTGSVAARAYAASTAPTKAGVAIQTLEAEKGKHSCKGKTGRLQDWRQQLQGQKLLQGQGRLRDGRQQAKSAVVP